MRFGVSQHVLLNFGTYGPIRCEFCTDSWYLQLVVTLGGGYKDTLLLGCFSKENVLICWNLLIGRLKEWIMTFLLGLYPHLE